MHPHVHGRHDPAALKYKAAWEDTTMAQHGLLRLMDSTVIYACTLNYPKD
ncbi:uncharacterized protein LACBIDRAFT_305616 [Laccaria bicolor S238N-H82]|uniref:Predicted protein n=1 Tax=Laccaria bicolor (strain S238N-H82 / ATCC MYA-4686) TaxID=486041 RepID=B0CUN5_LACBS|nr:uncharacterized protein LACBIDRAFT_305616 [Laccaria bicolor S238N-H82]EDR14702.1 predicted protein [Laccaria bicolor S238N-H82]|eukprot:XP_001875261.1 predicted protein [Laccaria bicolor S238N-H82]